MSSKPVVLTHEGFKKLDSELEFLKTVKRKEIAEKIKEARGFGDLSENAEYDEAKKEQAEIEARILKLDTLMRNAEIVDESELDTKTVSIGTKVKVFDYAFDEEVDYTLVGTTEADPFENRISNDSPIGAALIGKKIGDIVEVPIPEGTSKLKVLEIYR